MFDIIDTTDTSFDLAELPIDVPTDLFGDDH